MPSIIVLRAILGASISLGTVDLLWLDIALAPSITGSDAPVVRERTGPVLPSPQVEPPAPATPKAPEGARIYFASTSAALDDVARDGIADLVNRAGADSMLVLEGHTDPLGTEAFNRALGKQRALAVAGTLQRLGIARSRIRIAEPATTQVVTGELWRERRVEIQITGGPR